MNINCEHPVVILNPYLQQLIIEHKSYHFRGITYNLTDLQIESMKYKFPWHRFSVKRNGVGISEVDDSYIFNRVTGETYPLFIVVPCGKCVLCRDKKAREWSFRATCEGKYSETCPLFVTLTYNDVHLPSDGVRKDHLQSFFKRLRRSFERKNEPFNLRYFACSEYGSKKGRPHYHLILWNFPEFRSPFEQLRIIERAWSIYQGNDSNNNPVYDPIGFAYVGKVDKGAVSYVMKYMKKEQIIPRPYINKTFTLSSRRGGGIGYKYALEMAEYYRKNPQQLKISILDKWSGQIFSCFVPQYFKQLFYPSLCKVVPKPIRDLYKEYCHQCNMLKIYRLAQARPHDRMTTCCDIVNHDIVRKYAFLPNTIINHVDYDTARSFQYLSNDELHERVCSCISRMTFIEKALTLFPLDEELIMNVANQKELRKQALTSYFINEPEYDVLVTKEKLNNRLKLAQLREKL
ncbi:MAG: replication initiation protein [Microviridae sp.]|nr:MAG: replication initiation protein [Microviridae sp.]